MPAPTPEVVLPPIEAAIPKAAPPKVENTPPGNNEGNAGRNLRDQLREARRTLLQIAGRKPPEDTGATAIAREAENKRLAEAPRFSAMDIKELNIDKPQLVTVLSELQQELIQLKKELTRAQAEGIPPSPQLYEKIFQTVGAGQGTLREIGNTEIGITTRTAIRDGLRAEGRDVYNTLTNGEIPDHPDSPKKPFIVPDELKEFANLDQGTLIVLMESAGIEASKENVLRFLQTIHPEQKGRRIHINSEKAVFIAMILMQIATYASQDAKH